jgi:predicted transcriptional regulator of viral defense system
MIEEILKETYVNVNDKIMKFVKNNELIRLKKGVYCFSKEYRDTPLDLISISVMLYAPSYVSFEYALSYHGMIPERVEEITCATIKNNKLFETQIGRFSYKKIPEKAYSLGIEWLYDEKFGGRFIASAEKALCDKIRYDKGIGTLTQKSMITYLKEDLRIDLDFELDNQLIEKIAKAYKSKNLRTLAQVIRKGKI